MPPNRDVQPETLLQQLITAIERDEPRAYTSAMEALLTRGPLECRALEAEWSPLLRAELMQFLESIVVAAEFGRETYSPIGISGPLTLSGRLTEDGRVRCALEGAARSLVVMQLMMLLQLVGLRNVRRCHAPECRRIFVKTYRREYCSARCQIRENKRRQRRNDREKRERAAQRRQARRQKGA